MNITLKNSLCWAASIFSGILLAMSFPGPEKALWAWAAFVPLLLVVFAEEPRKAFRWGFLSGFVFGLLSLGWLLQLTTTSPTPIFFIGLGWLFLAAYVALYTAAFSAIISWGIRQTGLSSLGATSLWTLGIPVVWVGLEYLRSVLLLGFPWNPLGGSQFRNLPAIQIAEWVGVYGVSFLVMVMNAGIALTILRYFPHYRKGIRSYRPHPELFIAAILVLLCVTQIGPALLRRHEIRRQDALIAVVQPNIAQTKKWSDEESARNMRDLDRLTRGVFAWPVVPDLIVWPETVIPDPLQNWRLDVDRFESWTMVDRLLTNGIPILAGAMLVNATPEYTHFFNGSVLLHGSEGIVDVYAKQHLVPVGEYIPGESVIPILERLSPFGWSCTPGRRPTVFSLRNRTLLFSVLICFEDTVSDLARIFVLNGARILVNQTNDAWFDGSLAPVQHLSHSVLRGVENRVPVIRSANTGVSGFIDCTGRIGETLFLGPDRKPIEGLIVSSIAVPDTSMPLTLYTKHGDWMLARPCALATVLLVVLALIQKRRKCNKTPDSGGAGDAPLPPMK